METQDGIPFQNELSVLAESALKKFVAGDVDGFNGFLQSVPLNQRHEILAVLDRLTTALNDPYERGCVLRRVGQHPHFEGGIEVLPVTWRQAILFINRPDLKTRVNIGLCPMINRPREQIDYDIAAYDQKGQRLFTRFDTIHLRQTHSIALADLLPPQVSCGILTISTADRELGSLRAYASWYNDHGMTTTHERGALRSTSPYAVCPNIIASAHQQTWLAICNPDDAPRTFVGNLHTAVGARYHQDIRASVVARGTLFFNLSEVIPDLEKFLAGQSGILYCEANDWLMPYYFIHDTRRGTWQIQHL
jgi:hypothetical protein